MIVNVIRNMKEFKKHYKNIKEKGCYIAGPISGVNNYKDEFIEAEKFLNEQNIHTVFNPIHNPPGLEYDAYFPICYAMIDAIGTIVFLKKWRKSKGARREMKYATKSNKKYNIIEYGKLKKDIERLKPLISSDKDNKNKIYHVDNEDAGEVLIRLTKALHNEPYGIKYENDVFRMEPYDWSCDEEENQKPNFLYKPTGLELRWYKYISRGTISNQNMTVAELENIIDECIKSLP